mmetsp:Transcript_20980/g.44241  ORF Transcript_20980/g.44241 Transcript_20980/m.44241 type:complete len:229 (-) Transcript_20980:10-696(-)
MSSWRSPSRPPSRRTRARRSSGLRRCAVPASRPCRLPPSPPCASRIRAPPLAATCRSALPPSSSSATRTTQSAAISCSSRRAPCARATVASPCRSSPRRATARTRIKSLRRLASTRSRSSRVAPPPWRGASSTCPAASQRPPPTAPRRPAQSALSTEPSSCTCRARTFSVGAAHPNATRRGCRAAPFAATRTCSTRRCWRCVARPTARPTARGVWVARRAHRERLAPS